LLRVSGRRQESSACKRPAQGENLFGGAFEGAWDVGKDYRPFTPKVGKKDDILGPRAEACPIKRVPKRKRPALSWSREQADGRGKDGKGCLPACGSLGGGSLGLEFKVGMPERKGCIHPHLKGKEKRERGGEEIGGSSWTAKRVKMNALLPRRTGLVSHHTLG